jgi:RecJ-like exonuclease
MKVHEILREQGNFGPADDMGIEGPYNMNRIEGPYDISTPNGQLDQPSSEQEEDESDVCERCHGRGLTTIYNHNFSGADADDQECPDCEGTGKISGGPYGEQEEDEDYTCNQCNGSGEGQYDGSRCYKCKGSGVIKPHEEPDPDFLRDRQRDSEFDGSGPDRSWSLGDDD